MAINMVRNEREEDVQEVAEQRVEERLLDLLIPPLEGESPSRPADPAGQIRGFVVSPGGEVRESADEDTDPETRKLQERRERTREKFRALLREEKLEEREVEVEVQQSPMLDNMMVPLGGTEGMDFNFGEM